MTDYVFQLVELCQSCGKKVPKKKAVRFDLFVGGQRVNRFLCGNCFQMHVMPLLLAEGELLGSE